MFPQVIRASRSSVARVARQSLVAKRTFITPTAIRQADLVQEMYLRELKAYKPTPIKSTDSEGQVSVFHIPTAPKSPEEVDIANELKSYEAQTVELEGQAEEGSETATDTGSWFEEEEFEEEKGGH